MSNSADTNGCEFGGKLGAVVDLKANGTNTIAQHCQKCGTTRRLWHWKRRIVKWMTIQTTQPTNHEMKR